jgi:putative serine protease PepD
MLDHVTASLLGVKVISNAGGAQIEKEEPGKDKKSGVTKDSPAEKAGLKPGDVIRKLDGVMLPNADQFHTVLAGKKPGAVVTLVVSRNGREHTFKATLAVDKRKAWEDVQWALINAKEFLFRH